MSDQVPEYVDTKKMQDQYDMHVAALRKIEEDALRYGVVLRKQPATTTPPKRLDEMSIRDAVYTVLQEQSEPMHLSEIYERLKAGGVRIKGDNPKNTVFGTIRGDKRRFVNLGRNRWDLAERQVDRRGSEETEQ